MKKLFIKLTLILGLIFMASTPMMTSSCAVEEQCNWYVYDAQGILTGYTSEANCHEWARKWNDVICTCR